MNSRIIEIEKKLQWQKLNLYEDLGKEILGQPLLPGSTKEQIRVAKKWLSEKRPKLVRQICKNEVVKSFREDSNRFKNKVYLISAMCDAIISAVQGVSVVTVCILIFHEGLEELCSSFQKNKLCIALTIEGKPCKNKAKKGFSKCHVHLRIKN